MEIIPQTGTSLMIDNYTIEIIRVSNNAVQTARVQDTNQTQNEIEESEKKDISSINI
jgi:Mg2+/Co2+ transporter CorB